MVRTFPISVQDVASAAWLCGKESARQLLAALDGAMGRRKLHRMFKAHHGYDLDLANPRTYNEKLQWRKVHDRNPLFTVVSDKVRMREFAVERLGARATHELFIPHLFVVRDPDEIPYDDLPDDYVIKASHASGWNHFVRNGRHPRSGPERRKLRGWMLRGYGDRIGEWGYRGVPRRLVGEPLQLAPDGSFPEDIKLYMFDGRCYTIHHNVFGRQDTVGSPKTLKKVYMSPTWEKMDIATSAQPSGEASPRPFGLDRMLEIGAELSAGFDFIRVDFLSLPDRFYLGELTVYPSSGLKPLVPRSADVDMGAVWKLPGRNVG